MTFSLLMSLLRSLSRSLIRFCSARRKSLPEYTYIAELEHTPQHLVGHFVVKHDLATFDQSTQFARTAVSCQLFQGRVLAMNVIAQYLTQKRTPLELPQGSVDVIR